MVASKPNPKIRDEKNNVMKTRFVMSFCDQQKEPRITKKLTITCLISMTVSSV